MKRTWQMLPPIAATFRIWVPANLCMNDTTTACIRMEHQVMMPNGCQIPRQKCDSVLNIRCTRYVHIVIHTYHWICLRRALNVRVLSSGSCLTRSCNAACRRPMVTDAPTCTCVGITSMRVSSGTCVAQII